MVSGDTVSEILQLIVPKSRRAEVMEMHHSIPSATHLDAKRTMERIKNVFYWPGMKVSVTEFCRLCDSCAARKSSPKQNKAPMGQISSGAPMEKVCIDILGLLPLTRQKHKYIQDIFTKWTEAVPLPDQEVHTVTKAFVDTFVAVFVLRYKYILTKVVIVKPRFFKRCAPTCRLRRPERQASDLKLMVLSIVSTGL